MTLTLNLTPDKTARLQEQARQAGLPLEDYVQQVLEQTTLPAAPPTEHTAEIWAEKAARFRRWADSQDRTIPVIPMEALDREHLYEERG